MGKLDEFLTGRKNKNKIFELIARKLLLG